MDARALRECAIRWLRAQWPAAVIIPELSVGSWGAARLDVAAVTREELIGVEIKGEGDSTARLSLQGMLYSSVCSRMFLLPAPALREKCIKAKPPGWLMACNKHGDWWSNTDERADRQTGFGYDGKQLPTSAIRLMDLLWSAEVKYVSDVHGVYLKQGAGREARVRAIAEELPLKLLRPTVLYLLHARQWEGARFGSKLIYRPADEAAA